MMKPLIGEYRDGQPVVMWPTQPWRLATVDGYAWERWSQKGFPGASNFRLVKLGFCPTGEFAFVVARADGFWAVTALLHRSLWRTRLGWWECLRYLYSLAHRSECFELDEFARQMSLGALVRGWRGPSKGRKLPRSTRG